MTVCTYWSQVLDTGLLQMKGKLPSQHILMLVFYHLPLNSCLLEVFMQLIVYHLPDWSETFIEWEPLLCPARELPLVMFSVLFTNPSWVTWRFLQLPMHGEKKVLCALAGGLVLQNYQAEFSHLSYKDDSTELSTLEETMNFFSCKLMALLQPIKFAFLHTSAPLLFVSCTYFWSW